jgi:hypothetical protein
MQFTKIIWPGWEGSCEVRQLGDSRPNHILMLINGCDIRIIHATTGELIRELILNPAVDYQARGVRIPRPNPTSRFECFLSLATS